MDFSEYFRTLLGAGFKEGDTGIISPPDEDPDLFAVLLEGIYKGQTNKVLMGELVATLETGRSVSYCKLYATLERYGYGSWAQELNARSPERAFQERISPRSQRNPHLRQYCRVITTYSFISTYAAYLCHKKPVYFNFYKDYLMLHDDFYKDVMRKLPDQIMTFSDPREGQGPEFPETIGQVKTNTG
jgi:hypothetical protein